MLDSLGRATERGFNTAGRCIHPVDVGSRNTVARLVDRAIQTRRGNLVAGVGLWLVSVLGFALTRALASTLPANAGETLWLPLVMAIVSVPAFAGVVLLAAGSGMGFPEGLRAGVAAYALIGAFVVLFGLGSYLPSGVLPAGPFWPFFILWLHPCLLGFGLWPCLG